MIYSFNNQSFISGKYVCTNVRILLEKSVYPLHTPYSRVKLLFTVSSITVTWVLKGFIMINVKLRDKHCQKEVSTLQKFSHSIRQFLFSSQRQQIIISTFLNRKRPFWLFSVKILLILERLNMDKKYLGIFIFILVFFFFSNVLF